MQVRAIVLSVGFLVASGSSALGQIKGVVRFTGPAPAAKPIDMSVDPLCKTLGKGARTDDVLVAGGKLANVFAYLKNAPEKTYPVPSEPVVLDQKGCMYAPKVFGLMKGQKLEIRNSDGTLHNVHAFAKRGEFNIAMPKQGQKVTRSFKKAEIMVPIRCDIHEWMGAYAAVLEHPYFAVSGQDGELAVPTKDLPDGAYELVLWHATLGERTVKVSTKAGAASFELVFGE